jgi:hypothetical protein
LNAPLGDVTIFYQGLPIAIGTWLYSSALSRAFFDIYGNLFKKNLEVDLI